MRMASIGVDRSSSDDAAFIRIKCVSVCVCVWANVRAYGFAVGRRLAFT